VSLIAEDDVDSFISKIRDTYPPYRSLEGAALQEAIFATKPSGGACGKCFCVKLGCRVLIGSSATSVPVWFLTVPQVRLPKGINAPWSRNLFCP